MAESKRAYVLGHPIAHSISPAIHNAGFRQLGLPIVFSTWDVPNEELPAVVAALRANDVVGASVTVPHKERVMPLLDRIDPVAEIIGAVNTIYKRDGLLHGTNTDAAGFLRPVLETGFEPNGAAVVMLGAGGAARAVCQSLLEAGAGEIVVANRTVARAEGLLDRLRPLHPGARLVAVSLEALPEELVRDCDLLVNVTTVGMHEDMAAISTDVLPRGALVVDIIYNPPRTRLLRDAEAAGLRTLNGLPMLVYQAGAADEIWTGQEAPTPVMFAAAREALSQR